jgi:hypothetical protein
LQGPEQPEIAPSEDKGQKEEEDQLMAGEQALARDAWPCGSGVGSYLEAPFLYANAVTGIIGI